MKKFTQLFAGLVCAALLVTSAFAANTSVTATNGTPVVVQTVKAPATSTSLFNAKELGLSLASGYNLGTAQSLGNGKNPFTKAYTLNANAGVFYFPWRNLGGEVNVPFYQNQGVSVSEVQFGSLIRVPLASETPLFKNVAPYIGLGGVYNWQTDAKWAYIGKVGTEVRLTKSWGVFVEGQYRNSELNNWGQGNTSINGGLKLVF